MLSTFSSTMASVGSGMAVGLGIGLFDKAAEGIGAIFSQVGKGFKLAADFEQVQVSLETMLGSANNAKVVIADLQKFAASTPFEFPELAEATKKLVAFGIETNKLMPTLNSVGDVAAGLAIPVGDLAEMFGKVKVQGKLTGETIQNLSGRGVPIIQALAKQFGVAEGEVGKLVESGKVGFTEFEKAFTSLTGEGGKFAGMMQKQSTTAAGLFSTLSDNINMAFMGIAQRLMDALNLKGVMSNLIDGIGAYTDTVVDYVGNTVGIILRLGQTIWGWAQGVYSVVAPVMVSIGETIANVWRSSFDSIVGFTLAIYNVVAETFVALWTEVKNIASGIWTGLVAAWQWGADMLGFSAQNAANNQLPAWQRVVNVLNWVRDAFTYGLNVIAFSISHWRTFVELAFTNVGYSIAKLFNQVQYFFTEAIPYTLGWLSRQWFQIFTTIANYTATVFNNIVGNVGRVLSNLPGIISGSVSLGDLWTPLTEGAQSAITEAFKLPERQVGTLEAGLAAEAQRLGKGISDDFGKYMDAKKLQATDAAKALSDRASDVVKQFTELPPRITVPAPKLDVPKVEAPKDLTVKSDEKKQSKAVLANSAEAQRLAYASSGVRDFQKEQLKKQSEANTHLAEIAKNTSDKAAKVVTIG